MTFVSYIPSKLRNTVTFKLCTIHQSQTQKRKIMSYRKDKTEMQLMSILHVNTDTAVY
jgi:hypothetical protein